MGIVAAENVPGGASTWCAIIINVIRNRTHLVHVPDFSITIGENQEAGHIVNPDSGKVAVVIPVNHGTPLCPSEHYSREKQILCQRAARL